jgi:hypothetical protein
MLFNIFILICITLLVFFVYYLFRSDDLSINLFFIFWTFFILMLNKVAVFKLFNAHPFWFVLTPVIVIFLLEIKKNK